MRRLLRRNWILCSPLQEPESIFPVDEKPYKIVLTFTKEMPYEPVTADLSLLGCFKPCELCFLTSIYTLAERIITVLCIQYWTFTPMSYDEISHCQDYQICRKIQGCSNNF